MSCALSLIMKIFLQKWPNRVVSTASNAWELLWRKREEFQVLVCVFFWFRWSSQFTRTSTNVLSDLVKGRSSMPGFTRNFVLAAWPKKSQLCKRKNPPTNRTNPQLCKKQTHQPTGLTPVVSTWNPDFFFFPLFVTLISWRFFHFDMGFYSVSAFSPHFIWVFNLYPRNK